MIKFNFASLFGGFGLALASLAISLPALAKKTPYPAFFIVDDMPYTKVTKEIPNMPKVLDQKEFGICSAMAATTISQWALCQAMGVTDCKSPPAEFSISPLSMVAAIHPNTESCTIENGVNKSSIHAGELPQEFCGRDLSPKLPMTYRNLGFFGGAPSTAMEAMSIVAGYKTDACYQAENLIIKHGKTEADTKAFEKSVQDLYRTNKGKIETCDSCLKSLAEQANRLLVTTKITADNAKFALEKDTPQEFLYSLVFRDCPDYGRLGFGLKLATFYFPKKGYWSGETIPQTMRDVTDKMMEVLNDGYPVILSMDLCTSAQGFKCSLGHSLVISGFKEVCKDPSCATSRILLKVQNSWGEEFSNKFGEWFDRDTMIGEAAKSVTKTRGIISWMEPRYEGNRVPSEKFKLELAQRRQNSKPEDYQQRGYK